MPNHAPFLTTLRPGVVKVTSGAETAEYVVTGGFAEISPTAATILAEDAVLLPEADASMLEGHVARAERDLADAPPEARMAAGQRVRDLITLRAQLGG
jgi:F-type H+-transporting ATPase subunit epsilon